MPIVSGGLGTTTKTAGPWWGQYNPDSAPVGSAYTDPSSPKYSPTTAKRAASFYGEGGQQGGFGQQGSGGAMGSSSFGSGTFGGKNPFATDAAAAKLRDEFARMRKRTSGGINEDLSARGIFSSGVGADLSQQAMTQLDLQEASGLEDLFNRSAQQQMAFQLEQQRMANDDARARASQGAMRFGNANENQATQEALRFGNSKGATFGGGTMTDPASGGGGGGGATVGAGGEPVRGSGESFNDFNARWQSWFRNKDVKAAATGASGAVSGWADSAMEGFGGMF